MENGRTRQSEHWSLQSLVAVIIVGTKRDLKSAQHFAQPSGSKAIESRMHDCTESTKNETTTAWQRFRVEYEYPVVFTTGLFDIENDVFRTALCRQESDKRHRMVVFIDDGVHSVMPELREQIINYADRHASQIELAAEPVTIPAGEALKSDLKALQDIQQVIIDNHIDRHSFVVGVGGGALLDAVGLVAATAHRGIRHIRVPTTVLSQNDSGVGVKNGVNLFGQKNYIGTFAPPFAVLNDYAFIETLPERDKIAGMAEAIKVALIRDGDFFSWLEANADNLRIYERTAMTHMIRHCAELHMHQIAHGGDPFESGSARPLDYGHWSAHKLELLTDYRVRHGEAVAIGIALDARYSVLSGLLAKGEDVRICELLERLGFSLWHPELKRTDRSGELQIAKGIADFREHLGGELTITLLASAGSGVEVHEMNDDLIRESIAWLEKRAE